MTQRTILTLVVLAGLVSAGAAQASSIEELANLGYSTKRTTGVDACVQWNSMGAKDAASGYGASADFGCVNGPDYNSAIDAFAAGHLERKFGYENPEALQARDTLIGKGYAVAVRYVSASLTVSGGCIVDVTLTAETAKAYADAAPVAAPCPPPAEAPASAPAPPAEESVVVTEPVAGTVEERLDALEARYEELANRVNAITLANRAAWDTLVRLLGLGRPAYEAALGARSAGLNAMYGLDG